MVSRSYYPPSHPHDGARYSSTHMCAPYSTYSERRYLPSHDARTITMTDPQTDDSMPPRKRIAVACGRCRKRKIRCSGDPGGGMPCVNCKNAGVDSCLFLRVQSHEATMRDDNRYEYNMDVSRTLAQRGAGSMTHISSSLAQYPQEMPVLASGGISTSYRGSGYPTVNTKGYYYSLGTDLTDAYGTAADGSVEYGLSCPPYQVISSDSVQMPVASSYGTWPTARPKSTTQGGGSGGGACGSLYLDSDSGYGSYGPTGSTTSLVHRPAVSVAAGDSSPYSFSGFAASLPSAGASSSERLLPTPVSRAAAASTNTSYRTDGLSANAATTSCYVGSRSGHASPSVVGAATGIQGSPTSPISEITGYASSAYDYATNARSTQHQQHQHQHHGGGSSDVYGSISNGGAETIFGDADRSAGTQGPAVDLSGYTYGAPSPADSSSLRRASSGSALTSRSTAESSTSSVSYGGSDGGPPPSSSVGHGIGAYQQHHSSSSASHGHLHHQHGGHHHHHHQILHQQQQQQQQQHASTSHHTPPRHGSHHHISEQQRVVAGGTAYGAGSTGSNGIGGGGVCGSTAAAADSTRRPSVATRR